MRSGRLSYDDMSFIEKNWKQMSYTEIGRSLDKSIPAIKKYVETKIKNKKTVENKVLKIEYDIRARPFWPELEQQFSEEELPLFEYHWQQTIGQFKDDVTSTEEIQIVDMITMVIMMGRLMKDMKRITLSIKELEADIFKLREAGNLSPEDIVILNGMETTLNMRRSSQQAWTKEYKELSMNKNKIMENLKATRKDRVQNIENSRQTFVGFLKLIISDKERRKEWGIELEKKRIAVEEEAKRLTNYHTYSDGIIDQPLLTPENIREDNELR